MKADINNLVELIISLYIGVGVFFLNISHYYSTISNNYLNLNVYSYPIYNAIFNAYFFSLSIFLTSFIFLVYTKVYFLINTIKYTLCYFTIILTLLLISIYYSGFFSFINLGFIFIISIIVSFSIYIKNNDFVHIQSINQKFISNKKRDYEVIKLYHTETLQSINLIVTSILLFITGVVVVGILPNIKIIDTNSYYGNMLAILLWTLWCIYYIIGLWFGIISQLYRRLDSIKNIIINDVQ